MQKFWRILKKVMIILSVLSCTALFVIVLTSAVQKQKQLTCKNLTVKIDYESGLAFLSEKEIKDRINFLSGEEIIGKTIAHIDFKTLEHEVNKNPFVANAQIYVNQQQNVIVEVVQKRPILRILNNDGVGYYLSEKNERIPLCDKFTAHVAVAVGKVQSHTDAKRDSAVQNALFNLVTYIRKDDFLNALVDQIDVKDNGDMDLIPKVTGHIVHFGNGAEDMEGKFNRMKIFYQQGLRKVGWAKYKSIDLRFVNQVVCEKRDTVGSGQLAVGN